MAAPLCTTTRSGCGRQADAVGTTFPSGRFCVAGWRRGHGRCVGGPGTCWKNAFARRVRHHDVALPSRRDRAHGWVARPPGPNEQLGDNGRGGDVVRLAFDGQRASRRAAVCPVAAVDRGAAISLLRLLPGSYAPARTSLFRADILAAAGLRVRLAVDRRRRPACSEIPHFATSGVGAPSASKLHPLSDPAAGLDSQTVDSQSSHRGRPHRLRRFGAGSRQCGCPWPDSRPGHRHAGRRPLRRPAGHGVPDSRRRRRTLLRYVHV